MQISKGLIGPILMSSICLGGFSVVSFLAMKPELAGVKESVVLYLLGAWQTLAGMAAGYWLGTSYSSSKKDDTISNLASKP